MSWSCLIGILRDWQTLISALLALGAAWWTIDTIKKQIALDAQRHFEERQRHDDALSRKALAARAQMPDALSALCRFTEGCMRFLDGRADARPDRAEGAIDTLKLAIEFVDPQPAQKVFELVSFYQVHNARLFSGRDRRGPELAEGMYDTALLRFYVDRLYEYARNESDLVNENEGIGGVVSALKAAVTFVEYVGNEAKYAATLKIISRRHKDGAQTAS